MIHKKIFWNPFRRKAEEAKGTFSLQDVGAILNRPLLLHADYLSAMLWGLRLCASQQQHIDVPEQEAVLGQIALKSFRVPVTQEGLAIIPVRGVMFNRLGGLDSMVAWFFGDTSYETIREQFRTALKDPAVKSIVFDCDSPGGEVSGCFDLADEIYQARGTKPIYAIVNETAFSAAYAIASAAEKIYLSRTAKAGSIGVITVHLDQSKYDENLGAKYTTIYAGARKGDFNRHAALSPEAQAIAQSMVNDAYEIFVKTVARNRSMTTQAVRTMEAGLYFGQKAVAAGLANAVMPWTKALESITGKRK
ncbi:MAG: S49 family peptidase [Syntrophus sp. (in: bacteria)]